MRAEDALALSKSYTNKTLQGAGMLKGEKGDKGDKGDTPIKGIDYWTEADKQEIVDEVLSGIKNGNEVAY